MVKAPNRKGIFTRKNSPRVNPTVVNWATRKQVVNEDKELCKKNSSLRPFLRDETFMEAFERSMIFLYYKMKGEPIPQDTKHLSKDEMNELKFAIQGFNGTFEEMSEEIFHQELHSLNQELSDYEQYLPERILNKGTNYQRCAYPVSTYLPRLVSLMIKSEGQLQYAADYSDAVCSVSGNANDFVTTLNSNTCITFAHSQSELDEYPEEVRAKSYVILTPEFMPVESSTPITIKANRLLSLSFVIDAFKNGAIQSIEPTLLETLKKEAPELLEIKDKEPVILITPRYLNTETTRDRFIVVDPSGLPRGRNVRNASNFKNTEDDLIQRLFEEKHVYLVDARTATELRLKTPELWLSNFNDPNLAIFNTLSPNEQLAISFLQYIEALRRFSVSMYKVNMTNETRRKNTNKAIQNASAVYSEDLTSLPTITGLFENLEDTDSFEWNELKELQQKVTGSVTIQTPKDIVVLLRKLNRSFLIKNLKGAFNQAYAYTNRGNRVRALMSR